MAYSDPRIFGRIKLRSASLRSGACRYVMRSEIKRGFDIILCLVILGAIWPFLAFVYLGVALQRKGPVVQGRPVIGQDGVEFAMLHFNPDPKSRLGQWLRRSGLRYLPQLFNVLSGQMSFVGPRPLQIQDFDRFTSLAGLYMKTRPGISGPWLVSSERKMGRIAQARLDRTYIKNGSFLTDLRILLRTPFVFLRRI